jgi:hypothetical protein
MQLVYAFAYYFTMICIAFTFLLVVFAFRPCRKLLQKFQTKYQDLLNNTVYNYAIYISFGIIFLILIDSLRAYFAIHSHFVSRTHPTTKNKKPSR